MQTQKLSVNKALSQFQYISMKTLTLLAVCAWLICGRSATLKRLRRANYVENYRLNHFTLDKRYLFNPLGDFGDQVTRMKRDQLLHKRSKYDSLFTSTL